MRIEGRKVMSVRRKKKCTRFPKKHRDNLPFKSN